MSTLVQNRSQRARKESERGLAFKEYQQAEAAQKRKRISRKDKENIDEAARAVEDEDMFQTRQVPAAAKAKQPRAPPINKPTMPRVALMPKANTPPMQGTTQKTRTAQQEPRPPARPPARLAAPAAQTSAPAQPALRGADADRARPSAGDGLNTEASALQRARPAPVTIAVAGENAANKGQFDFALPSGLAGTVKKARKPRPVARDLDPERAALVQDACFAFRALVAAFNPFPSAKAKRNMFNAAWQYALSERKLGKDTLPTQAEVKLVLMRTEQMRGNIKTIVRAAFPRAYGFKTPVRRRETTMINENIKEYEMLNTRDAYVYENPREREGLYHAPIILDAIIAIWFAKRNDEGPAFPDLFNPNGEGIRLETIALILAALQNCLEEWQTGQFQEIQFRETAYRSWYEHHLKSLQRYAKHKALAPICARLRKDMYRAGMFHSGAMVQKVETNIGITDEDLDAAAAYYAAGNDPSDTESESEEERNDDGDVPTFAQLHTANDDDAGFEYDHIFADQNDGNDDVHDGEDSELSEAAAGSEEAMDDEDDAGVDAGTAEGGFFDEIDDNMAGGDHNEDDIDVEVPVRVTNEEDAEDDEDELPPPPKRRCTRM